MAAAANGTDSERATTGALSLKRKETELTSEDQTRKKLKVDARTENNEEKKKSNDDNVVQLQDWSVTERPILPRGFGYTVDARSICIGSNNASARPLSNFLYVAAHDQHAIIIYDKRTGKMKKEIPCVIDESGYFGTSFSPSAVDINGDRIYVVSDEHNFVYVYDGHNGDFVKKYKTIDNCGGYSVAVSRSKIYVACMENVVCEDESGSTTAADKIISIDKDSGAVEVSHELAVEDDGGGSFAPTFISHHDEEGGTIASERLVIIHSSNPGESHIYNLTRGKAICYINIFEESGYKYRDLCHPTVAASGMILIPDKNNHRILKFNSVGGYLGYVTKDGKIVEVQDIIDVCVDQNYIYILARLVNSASHGIYRVKLE